MRKVASNSEVTVKAYAGTTGILLAFNLTDESKFKGLLGFAISRKRTGQPEKPNSPLEVMDTDGFKFLNLIVWPLHASNDWGCNSVADEWSQVGVKRDGKQLICLLLAQQNEQPSITLGDAGRCHLKHVAGTLRCVNQEHQRQPQGCGCASAESCTLGARPDFGARLSGKHFGP